MEKLTGRLNGAASMTGRLANTVSYKTYDGDYIITPKAWDEQVLETQNKLMADNVTVLKVPYYETSNPQGGMTLVIAEEQ